MDLPPAPTSALATLSLLFNLFEKLLHLDYRSVGERFDRIRIQFLTQRTRLQYIGDMIRLDSDLSPEAECGLKYCLEDILSEGQEISKIQRDYATLHANYSLASTGARFLYLQKMRWAMRDRERLEESLIKLRKLTDRIESILHRRKGYRFGSEGAEPSTMKGNEHTTFLSNPVKGSGSRDEDESQTQEEAQKLFRSLCFICENSLKIVSSRSATLKDTFLSYLLWMRTINSENVVAMFTQSPAQIDDQNGPDLLKIHYELLAQMAWILGWLAPFPKCSPLGFLT
jgi:hypothetical protein